MRRRRRRGRALAKIAFPLRDLTCHLGRVIDARQERRPQFGSLGPPYGSLLRALELEESGRTVVGMDPAPGHENNHGSSIVTGGILATLADIGLGTAIMSVLEPNQTCPTLDLRITFFRPARFGGGRLRADSRVVHRGSQAAVAECTISDASGTAVASASATGVIRSFPPRSA